MALIEPVFICQCADPATPEQIRNWIHTTYSQGRALAGADFFRTSIHPDNRNMVLVEGWERNPGDQGVARWQMEAA